MNKSSAKIAKLDGAADFRKSGLVVRLVHACFAADASYERRIQVCNTCVNCS